MDGVLLRREKQNNDEQNESRVEGRRRSGDEDRYDLGAVTSTKMVPFAGSIVNAVALLFIGALFVSISHLRCIFV